MANLDDGAKMESELVKVDTDNSGSGAEDIDVEPWLINEKNLKD